MRQVSCFSQPGSERVPCKRNVTPDQTLMCLLVALRAGPSTDSTVGAASSVNPSDADVIAAAACAVAQRDTAYVERVDRVIRGTQQVVSGMMYRLVVTVGQTHCLKSSPSELQTPENCPVIPATIYTTQMNVWVQPGSPGCALSLFEVIVPAEEVMTVTTTTTATTTPTTTPAATTTTTRTTRRIST